MPNLDAETFADFFAELWCKPPFAWQIELARRVLNRADAPWPEAIALPTAAGKTACLDIAVYAMAAQALQLAPGQPLTAPRRIFFVVDRRVIVDEAFQRAQQLTDKLQHSQAGIVREVADRLRHLGGSNNPLACFQLRGGMYRSDAWAKSPIQPTIVASTVDQLGSRLLFRAYGRSFKAWPIHSGLAGNDSLILLDEAHCAQPFLETLQAVRRYRDWAESPLRSPFHVVIMSATPPDGLTDVFRDQSNEPKDRAHPLGARQQAAKPTKLLLADKAKGANANEELAEVLAKQAEDLVDNRPVAAVVFCNRVETARRAHARLAEKHGDRAVLLTGRMRPIDKDDTVNHRLALVSADRSATRQLDASLYVVATQTLEVGANLDFDVLVTECASLDALRQRFGRLNRMGRAIEAKAAILARADQAQTSDDDPVYSSALAATWKQLNDWAGEASEIDMGIAALRLRLEGTDLSKLNAPTTHAPVMLPAHVDCWAQTAPEPEPTPEVALFLHGPKSGPADVQVCWRADLVGADEQAWLGALALCPPSAPECLPVPIGLLHRWLTGEKAVPTGSDVEGVTDSQGTAAESQNVASHRVIRWRGRDDAEPVGADAIHPGDVVVIPASLGGRDMLAALGTSMPVPDWGDRAHTQARAKALLRLHQDILRQWPVPGPMERLSDIAAAAQIRFDEDPDGLLADIRETLQALAEDPELRPEIEWIRPIAESLTSDPKLARGLIVHPTGGLILRGSRRLDLHVPEVELLGMGTSIYDKGSRRLDLHIPDVESFSDEDDVSASGTVDFLLDRHCDGVAAFAARFARGCGLPDELGRVIESAGRGHDLGKADPRFQAWLRGGNCWSQGPLLAKSGDMAQGWKASEQARERANYPKGGRHELLSVRLLESAPEQLPEQGPLRDLLLHLIESHHGHCRPFAPAVADNEPVHVPLEFQGRQLAAGSATGLERLDSGVAERFWRLTRRYGWWGLTWLEAILRLADHRRSEAEQASAEDTHE